MPTATSSAFLWNEAMRIKIIDKEQNFSLRLPTGLLLNQFFASLFPLFINRKLKKYKIRLSGSMCRKFVRGFYKTRKHFGGKLELVEVESADGSFVKIIL